MSNLNTWAWQQNITAPQKLVLLALAEHAGFKDDTWQCWPKLATLADMTGLSERAIRSAIRALERAGLIHAHARHTNAGRQTSNTYTLNAPAPEYRATPTRRQMPGNPAPDAGGRRHQMPGTYPAPDAALEIPDMNNTPPTPQGGGKGNRYSAFGGNPSTRHRTLHDDLTDTSWAN